MRGSLDERLVLLLFVRVFSRKKTLLDVGKGVEGCKVNQGRGNHIGKTFQAQIKPDLMLEKQYCNSGVLV